MWVAGSVVVAMFYGTVVENLFGSPKEKLLTQQLENLKLQYTLIGRQLDNSMNTLNGFKLSDDIRYRPILDMDTIAETYWQAGYGGVDRFRDLAGYQNSNLLISYRTKIEDLKNRANVQNESFKAISERSAEWRREMDHFPGISPVSVMFRLGDGLKFRPVHPVLGNNLVCITVRILKFLMALRFMLPAMVPLLNLDMMVALVIALLLIMDTDLKLFTVILAA